MSLDLTNQFISTTFQKLLQRRGDEGKLYDLEGNEVTHLTIGGTLTAEKYVTSESIVHTSSGSTTFGNTQDDIHSFTGSISSKGSFQTTDFGKFGGLISGSTELYLGNPYYSNGIRYGGSKGISISGSTGGSVSKNPSIKIHATHMESDLINLYSNTTSNSQTKVDWPSMSIQLSGSSHLHPALSSQYTYDSEVGFRNVRGDLHIFAEAGEGSVIDGGSIWIKGDGGATLFYYSKNKDGYGIGTSGTDNDQLRIGTGELSSSWGYMTGSQSTTQVSFGTSSPHTGSGKTLTVEGDISSSGDVYLESGKSVKFETGAPTAANKIWFNSGGNGRMMIKSTAIGLEASNVQVGNVSATAPKTLTVEGDISASGDIYAGGNGIIFGEYTPHNVWRINTHSTRGFLISSGSSSHINFKIDSDTGNVGIKNNMDANWDPAKTLTVDGDISASGYIEVSSGSADDNMPTSDKARFGTYVSASSSGSVYIKGDTSDDIIPVLNMTTSGSAAYIDAFRADAGSSMNKTAKILINTRGISPGSYTSANQNVGIGYGITNPTYKLEVAGTIKGNGSFTLNDYNTSAGTSTEIKLRNSWASEFRLGIPSDDISNNEKGLYILSGSWSDDMIAGPNEFPLIAPPLFISSVTSGDGRSSNVNIASSNKVGIGTNVPTKKLVVVGDISASGDFYSGTRNISQGILSSSAQIGSDISGSWQDELSGSLYEIDGIKASDEISSSKALYIGSLGTNQYVSASDGNIKIGGDVYLDEDQRIYFESDKGTWVETDSEDRLRVVVGGSQMMLWDQDDGRAVFGNGSKVFIGSNNNHQPTHELEVDGTISGSTDLYIGALGGNYISASDGNLEINGAGTAYFEVAGDISASGDLYVADDIYLRDELWHINTHGAGYLDILSGSTSRLYFGAFDSQGGNLGIGTITPQKTLTVEGEISASGTSYLSNISASNVTANSTVIGSIPANSNVYANHAGFAHKDVINTGQTDGYALLQASDGKVSINAPDPQNITHYIGGGTAFQTDATMSRFVQPLLLAGGDTNESLRQVTNQPGVNKALMVYGDISASNTLFANKVVLGTNGTNSASADMMLTVTGDISASRATFSSDVTASNNLYVGGVYTTGSSATDKHYFVGDISSSGTIYTSEIKAGTSTDGTAVVGISGSLLVNTGSITPKGKFTVYYGDGTDTTGSLDTNGDGYGEIVKFGETTGLTPGYCYYLNTTGTWTEANATGETAGADELLAVALGPNSNHDGMLLRGFVKMTHHAATKGRAVYMSTAAGRITDTAPSSTGNIVRVLGYAIGGDTTIYFNPGKTWVTIS